MLGSRRAFAAAVLVVGCFGAGCGGTRFDHSAAPAPDRAGVSTLPPVVRNPALRAKLVQSVSLTSAARSARTSISVTLTGLGDDKLETGAFDIAGSGVVDFAEGNADLALSVPLYDHLGGGSVIEQRIVHGVVYTRMPAEILRASGMPAGVRWLSLDPKHASSAGTSSFSQSQADPAGQLAFVDATSDDVRRVGSDPVRGIPSTHYVATIDLGASAHSAGRVGAVRRKVAGLGAVIGTRRLPVDVWVDRDGRSRRVVVSVPLSAQPGSHRTDGLGARATMRIQADFFAFGTTVKVAAPPQAQVRPFSALRLAATTG